MNLAAPQDRVLLGGLAVALTLCAASTARTRSTPLDTELRRARRSQTPTSLVMFDIDRFKDVNGRYGHLCGDAVPAAAGVKIRDVRRDGDLGRACGGRLSMETAVG